MTLYQWQNQIRDTEVSVFENRCPVCKNEFIETAYGRLCFGTDCDVFDEYTLFEEKGERPTPG
jgi:CRISPR/Cas system-associated protein Cas10 (large subunit of type III CRISPR-Cas system)